MAAWPAEANYPHRPGARTARLTGNPQGVRLLRSGLPVATLPRGGCGLVDAVRVTGIQPLSARPAGPLGGTLVVLRDRRMRPLGVIPVADWLPEAGMTLDADEAWRRSRLPHVLAAAGLPVRTVRGYSEHEGLTPQSLAGARALRPSGGRSLLAYGLRLLLLLAWAALMIGYVANDRDQGWLAALETALALLVGLDTGLWASDCRRDRRSQVGSLLLRPAPAQPVTRAFATRAHLRRSPQGLAVVAAGGSERWLPLTGPGRVTALGVIGPAGATPVAVAFLDDQDRARALLPWTSWFAAAPATVDDLATALGVPVRSQGRPLGPLAGDLHHFDGTRAPDWPNPATFEQLYDPLLFPVIVTELFATLGAAPWPYQIVPAIVFVLTVGRYPVRSVLRRRRSRLVSPTGAGPA